MTPRLSLAASGLAVALAAATAVPAAHAAYYRDASAGGSCHPANGGAAAKFTYGNHWIANNNTTDQYVICDLPADDSSGAPWTVAFLAIHVYSLNAGATVTCVAQTGAFFDGTVYNFANVSRTYTFGGAGNSTTLSWENVLPRQANQDVLTLNCKMAPGMKLGLILRTEVQPG
jgi:hypothetical protein